MRLQIAYVMNAKVENRSRQRRVGRAFAKNFDEMFFRSSAAGGNYRDRYGLRDRRRQCAIEARLRSIAIHRCKQDFARASRFSFNGPLDGLASSVLAASCNKYVPRLAAPLSI